MKGFAVKKIEQTFMLLCIFQIVVMIITFKEVPKSF